MNETLKSKILNRMDELGVQPKRSLGQNFLVSDDVVKKIIQAAEASQFDETFEIGPGLGALTDFLAQQSQNLRLVELDKKFAQYWRDQGLEVIEQDALRHSWGDLLKDSKHRLLVSNLPYQISSRIVVDFSVEFPVFRRMVLMFQKEVAQRIQAPEGSGDYGLLSVVAQTYWKIRKVSEAGTVDFLPKPNVASRVLCFDRKENRASDLNHQDYLKFLKLCFANRRKVLLPKLKGLAPVEKLSSIFDELGIAEKARVEALSPESLQALYRALKTE